MVSLRLDFRVLSNVTCSCSDWVFFFLTNLRKLLKYKLGSEPDVALLTLLM